MACRRCHGRRTSKVGERRDLQSFAVIISELRLPGGLGTDLIQLAAPTPVIISSQSPSIAAAVDAIKLGAADFQPKPFDHDDLLTRINMAFQRRAQGKKPT